MSLAKQIKLSYNIMNQYSISNERDIPQIKTILREEGY